MTNVDINAHNHVEINKEEEITGVEQLFSIMLKLTSLLMSIQEKNTTKETLSEFPQMFFG